MQRQQARVVSGLRLAGRLPGWRTRASFGWAEGGVLAIYTFVIAITIPHHEPWADEAQAWLIARDNSLWQILRYRLHYEGSPGLWHVLLHVFHATGGRYGGIGWFGAVFAIAGMFVFLRWSPFPFLLRVLLPFTFFLQYQYAVISRSYVLFPLLAFGLCALFTKRRSSVWFALLAGLLANVSLQGTVFSFCMMGLYLWERYRRPDLYGTTGLRTWLRPVAVYVALLAVAAWTAVPAPDCELANKPVVGNGIVREALMHFPGPLPAEQRVPAWAVGAAAPRPAATGVPFAERFRGEPRLRRHPGAWAAWYIEHDRTDARGRQLRRPFFASLLGVMTELLSLATGPISTYKLLACAFLATLFAWMWFRRAMRMSLPWLANLVVGEALWIADHHTGMLLVALLTAVWLGIAVPVATGVEPRRMPQGLDVGLVLAMGIVSVLQITWTVVSIGNEFKRSYDPGPETAAFLRGHLQARMASFEFEATGVQPYFEHNPFFDLRNSYWVWAMDGDPDAFFAATIRERPEIVVFSEDLLEAGFMHDDWAPLSPDETRTQNRDLASDSIVQYLQGHGYRETHRFCGDRFMRLSASYRGCDLIFEPRSEAAEVRDQKSVNTSTPSGVTATTSQ